MLSGLEITSSVSAQSEDPVSTGQRGYEFYPPEVENLCPVSNLTLFQKFPYSWVIETGISKDVRLFGCGRHQRIKKNRLMSRRRLPPAGIRIVGSGQSRAVTTRHRQTSVLKLSVI